MFYDSEDAISYPEIAFEITELLGKRGEESDSLTAQARIVADSLDFVLSRPRESRPRESRSCESRSCESGGEELAWEFFRDELESLGRCDREAILLMKVERSIGSLLCLSRIEVNSRFRGQGVYPTLQKFLPGVFRSLASDYTMDFAIHQDADLTAYFMKNDRFAVHELKQGMVQSAVLDLNYGIINNVSVGLNSADDKSVWVRREFLHADVDARIMYYRLLSRFVDNVNVTLSDFLLYPSMLPERSRKFLFDIFDRSGFCPEDVAEMKSHNVLSIGDDDMRLLFGKFKRYFAGNYYQISQQLGMQMRS